MRKYARILVATTFLLGLSVAAKAESRAVLVVTLPFEVVVSGKILPAGTYTASRLSDNGLDGLMLTSRANGTRYLCFLMRLKALMLTSPV